MNPDLISSALCLVHVNGCELYPVKMKRRSNGSLAFRVSPGGTGGNKLTAVEEVDEETMIKRVLAEGYAVRCTSLDGATQGLYKPGQRTIRELRRVFR